MGKTKLSSALGLLFLLAASAFPRLALADPSGTVAMSKDDAALVAKVNGLYYGYKRLGLHKFKCELKMDMLKTYLDKLKAQSSDDPKYLALKDVQFFLSYDEKNGMKFTYTNYKPTGDPKSDADLKDLLGAAEQMAGMFWDNWYGPTFEPAIDTSSQNVTSLNVKKTPDGYEIDESQDKTSDTCVNILNSDLLITEADIRYKPGKGDDTKMLPQFTQTGDGLLMNVLTLTISHKLYEIFSIGYQKVSKYQLPFMCVLGFDTIGVKPNSFYSIEFSNYELN